MLLWDILNSPQCSLTYPVHVYKRKKNNPNMAVMREGDNERCVFHFTYKLICLQLEINITRKYAALCLDVNIFSNGLF